MSISFRSIVLTGPLVLLLSACGGGGGGGGDSSSLEPASFVPPQATLASLANPNAAALVASDADGWTRATINLISAVAALEPHGATSPSAVVRIEDEVHAGPEGGTVTLRGNFVADGTGWYQAVFAGYTEFGRTFDGRIAYRVNAVGFNATLGQVIATGTMAVSQLRVRAQGFDVTLDANLATLSSAGGGYVRIVSGDVDSRPAGGPLVQARGLSIDFHDACGATSAICSWVFQPITEQFGLRSGRLYLGALGYTDISALRTLESKPSDSPLLAAGRYRLGGAGGTRLEVECWSPMWLVQLLDDDGDGKAERFRSRIRTDLMVDAPFAVTPEAPQADAGGEVSIGLGTYRHSARGSHDANGEFLTAHWEIVRAPAGGVLTLGDVDTPEPTLSSTGSGDFILKLTVDDGTSTASDFIRLRVFGSGTPQPGIVSTELDLSISLGGDPRAAIGVPELLDARDSRTVVDTALGLVWTIESGPVGGALLEDLGDGRARFTATAPGYYEVQARSPAGSGVSHAVLVTAGGLQRWTPPLRYNPDGIVGVEGAILLDENADGLLDLIGGRSIFVAGNNLVVIRQTTPGRFAPPATYDGAGGSDHRPPVMFDADVDGRLDAVFGGVGLSYREADGSFVYDTVFVSKPNSFPCNANTFHPFSTTQIGDFDSNGVADVFAVVRGCDQRVFWFEASPGRAQRVAQQLDLPGPFPISPFSELSAVDLDADGRVDIVTTGGSDNELRIYRRALDGSLMAPTIELQPDFWSESVLVADVDGDGEQELVSLVSSASVAEIVIHRFVAGAWARATSVAELGLTDLTAGDADGDGGTDFITVHDNIGQQQVLGFQLHRYHAGGALAGTVLYPTPAIDGVSCAYLGDLDQDGQIDVIFENGYMLFGRAD